MWKTLEQIGDGYKEAAAPIHAQIKDVRQRLKVEQDAGKRQTLKVQAQQLYNILHDLHQYERWCKGYYTENRKPYEAGRTMGFDRRSRTKQPKRKRDIAQRALDSLTPDNTK